MAIIHSIEKIVSEVDVHGRQPIILEQVAATGRILCTYDADFLR